MVSRLNDIVIPAFLKGYHRRYSRSYYFFHDCRLINLASKENPIYALSGIFIRDVTLERSYTFDPSLGLQYDRRDLESAVFSYFTLVLHNHKLLFLPVTPDAPDINKFATSVRSFLTQSREDYVRREKSRRKDLGIKPYSLKVLREENPKPIVSVDYLLSKQKITHYLKRFQKLQRISLTILDTNQEPSLGPLFEQIRGNFDPLDPDKKEIDLRRKDGFNTEIAEKPLHEASEGGDADIKMQGKMEPNVKATVSGEELKERHEMEHLSPDREEQDRRNYQIFQNEQEAGNIREDEVHPSAVADRIDANSGDV